MPNRVQTLRSSAPGNLPQAGTRQPGELWVNFADANFGYIDASQTAQKLLAIRLFMNTAPYAVGDFVIYQGVIYRAIAPSSAGAFTVANWSKVGGAVFVGDVPPAAPDIGALWFDSVGAQLYVWFQDANSSQWVVAVNPGSGAAGLPDAPVDSTTYARNNGAWTRIASSLIPLMDGIATAGSAATLARGDHVHPVDTSRYAASNPSGFQTAGQVSASLAGYLPLAGGTLSGALTAANLNSSVTGGVAYVQLLSGSGAANSQLIHTDATGVMRLQNLAAGASNLSINVDGSFQISSSFAYKPGTPQWQTPSDARIKTVEGDYTAGLDVVLQLNPVFYRYKGNDTPTAEQSSDFADTTGALPYPASPNYHAALETKAFVGLVAQEVETVLPGMVGKRHGFIDGVEVPDIRTLDTGELMYTFINAIKELAARVAELEAAR